MFYMVSSEVEDLHLIVLSYSTLVLGDFRVLLWDTFICFTCYFYQFSHQLSLTRFICLLVCERISGAPFIPPCSMVLDVELDAYRRASDADAELGAFTYL